MNDTPELQTAVLLLSQGEPLPIDLVFRLLEDGIDVSALEDEYGL